MSFTHQLFGAWRAAGLDAAPRSDGELTFCCPTCTQPTRLDVGHSIVLCASCGWGADGDAWTIALAAREAHARASPTPQTRTLPLWALDELLNYQPDPKEEIWPGGILSMGERTALVGAPGVGKSRLALQAALCTMLGRPFLGWETRGAGLKWLFLQTENSARRLKADLGAMTRHLASDQKQIVRDGLRILNVNALDFSTICMVAGHPDRGAILETLAAWAPDIVVIDPLRDAGCGDPNKDADMTETCAGISNVVRHANPRRVPLVIHHGRTGAQEASKVFGDDAASFGRNSKVLYGWLRSQINVAPAGIDWPKIVVVGCGKNSNGPKWDPFAARLDEYTMTYHRLDPDQFDLNAWAEQMGAQSRKRRSHLPTPDEVAAVVARAGGEVRGGVNSPEGLVERMRREFGVTRYEAQAAIDAAVGQTVHETYESRPTGNTGGKRVRIYVLDPNRMYPR
jgi:hypothetical protein